MNKEEIEKAKFNLYDDLKLAEKEDSVDIDVFTHDLRTILNHTEQLEKQVKELKKGQASLIQSRKKWKNRYYKESVKVKEQEESKQEAIDKLKDEIELIDKCYEELFTNVSGIKVIDITGLSKKEEEEVINKRNCLLVQKHCYKKFLNMLEGEKNEKAHHIDGQILSYKSCLSQ